MGVLSALPCIRKKKYLSRIMIAYSLKRHDILRKNIFQRIFITDWWKVSKLSIKSPISSCFYFHYYFFLLSIHSYSFSLILSSFFIVHIQSNCFHSVADERSNWITAILDYKTANGDAPVHKANHLYCSLLYFPHAITIKNK